MFEEIKRAVNKYTGKEMILCENKGYGLFALIINGSNQKCSKNREEVENLFSRLSK